MRLFIKKPAKPYYRPNFITTVSAIGISIYLYISWDNYINGEDVSYALLVFWSIMSAPLFFAVLRSWVYLISHSIVENRGYGTVRCIRATIYNVSFFSVAIMFYGLAIIVISGFVSIIIQGSDLDLDFDIDSGYLDFDRGGELGWDTESQVSTPETAETQIDQERHTSAVHPHLEQVDGYIREDGTEVRPYVRTPADGNPFNNLSS
jgi:hypothetical protein